MVRTLHCLSNKYLVGGHRIKMTPGLNQQEGRRKPALEKGDQRLVVVIGKKKRN